ncbi:unnamed protein product [Phytophthora lilii]|uniref:Unnamed protein product n=1 Tax=Phytophthora lilii TaxID=2077276 RepID=A0A9W6TFJ1_9STRA|nr:unnamed protein product [Phytophthora lilii]
MQFAKDSARRWAIWAERPSPLCGAAEELAEDAEATADAARSGRGNPDFENYYHVLEIDEDFFPEEEELDVEVGASNGEKEDREKLFNEAFARDMKLEVVYFFLELEELAVGVFSIYDQVKKQQRTMVEATVVAKVAMDSASALTAKIDGYVLYVAHGYCPACSYVYLLAKLCRCSTGKIWSWSKCEPNVPAFQGANEKHGSFSS